MNENKEIYPIMQFLKPLVWCDCLKNTVLDVSFFTRKYSEWWRSMGLVTNANVLFRYPSLRLLIQCMEQQFSYTVNHSAFKQPYYSWRNNKAFNTSKPEWYYSRVYSSVACCEGAHPRDNSQNQLITDHYC